MRRSEMMPATVDPATMWTLNADKRSVRLTLPPLPVAGQPKPLYVALDLETTTVDEIIDRLLSLRAGMLPPLLSRARAEASQFTFESAIRAFRLDTATLFDSTRAERPRVRHRRTILIASLAASLSGLITRLALCRDLRLNIGKQVFHLETLGEARPTVVFEAGQGSDTTAWRSVAGPIAAFAKVVLYDRPGLGKSLPMVNTSSPITADQVATNLHALLTAAGIAPPYILVGHSLGGLYVQMFARIYPKEVAGVILLDSSSTDAPSELKTRARLEPGTAAYLEQEGVAESNRQVETAGRFPDVPVTVIGATDHGPSFKEWEPTLMRLQQGLAALSPQSALIVAGGSGHDVQVDRPDTVIDAVKQIAARVTTNR